MPWLNNKKLISYDIGPGNALIDDLSDFFYNTKFDKKGLYGKKGKLIQEIFDKFKTDIFFKKKYPKLSIELKIISLNSKVETFK